jgi:two-component system CheB/CheR fusion protein
VRLDFQIKDTGEGIAKEDLEQIFREFVQVRPASRRTLGGTGLGLAISRELAHLMGGDIRVESRLGQGSVFFFEALFGLAEDVVKHGKLEANTLSHPERPLRVLVAEDTPVNQQVILKMLEALGHEATLANDGREALDLLGQSEFDMVIMDIRMPNMNGEETTQAIRAGTVPGVRRDIPIVALTAYAMKGDRERLLAMGIDDYLSKPLELEQLLQALKQIEERI